MKNLFICSCFKVSSFRRSTCLLIASLYRWLLRMNEFSIQFLYFISVSFLGFCILNVLKPRTDSFRPRHLDLFFTSASATTVSSMSTVEMEVFSNSQLMILTLLMFIGGEVFTSMIGVHFKMFKMRKLHKKGNNVESTSCNLSSSGRLHQIDLSMVSMPNSENSKLEADQLHNQLNSFEDIEYLKYNSIKFLGLVVLSYFLVIQVLGVALIFVYLTVVSSARNVLKNKGVNRFTFSLFTTVSTFSNCGFLPTNENMIVFSKNSGLLLILIPQVLLGNTLFPSCLRLSIWFVGKFVKKFKSNYLLKNTREIGYQHLLPGQRSSLLFVTVLGFILIQFIIFCSMEWNSEALNGLSSYQKIICALFQTVNARHAGETIVDLSKIAPAILVLFSVMMYLPPYTSFLPIEDNGKQQQEECMEGRKKRRKVVENLIFSNLSYLIIFVIVVCITERTKLKEDPLNFNVLNIVVEVTSAYGNVGFSSGYSCERQLKPTTEPCENKWFGFAGKWSDEGKIVLIVIMFFGRLKKFHMDFGKAWKLQ